jgi:hypothetical protein
VGDCNDIRYAAVATIFAALGLSASLSRSDEYPTLNVAQVCHGIADQSDFQDALSIVTFDQCIQAEQNERDAITKQWSTFSLDDRKHCIAETTMGGDSSYTELLTCLEMSRDVKGVAQADQRSTSAECFASPAQNILTKNTLRERNCILRNISSWARNGHGSASDLYREARTRTDINSFSPSCYAFFNFASRAERKARSRCIFLTTAAWRSASSLSAPPISNSRR